MYGDGIINVIHKVILKQQVTLLSIEKETGIWRILKTVAMVAILVVGIAVFIYFAGPAVIAAAIKVAVATSFVGFAVTTVASGVVVNAVKYTLESFIEKVEIPTYSISPEEIFENEIPLFSVNFFNPSDETVEYIVNEYEPDIPEGLEDNWEIYQDTSINEIKLKLRNIGLNIDTPDYVANNDNKDEYHGAEKIKKVEVTKSYYVISEGNNQGTYLVKKEYFKNDNSNIEYEYYSYSHVKEVMLISDQKGTIKSYSKILHEAIQGWYYVFLSFAAIGMMSVLVYIGIRILLSSTAPEKAKYKEMIRDWFIGMILLFSMHYIMSFSNFFVDRFTDGIKAIKNKGTYVAMIQINSKMQDSMIEQGYTPIPVEDTFKGDIDENLYNKSADEQKKALEQNADLAGAFKNKVIYQVSDKSGNYWLIPTNLMGRLRIDLQTAMNESEGFIGYTVLFIMMVIYMIVFCITYIKRVVYMAFLTMIAPLVALTYAIDKTNDGKAQGFDTWFKEYVFNLLLQPLHLVLYTILVTSAIELALDNPIYAIVCLGFMTPAEKILRKMFNFEKAQTPGLFGGAAGGALLFSGMRWLMGRGKGNVKGKNDSEEGANGSLDKGGAGVKNYGKVGEESEGTSVDSSVNTTSSKEGIADSGEGVSIQGQEGINTESNVKEQVENPLNIDPAVVASLNEKKQKNKEKEKEEEVKGIKGAAKKFHKAYWRRATGGVSIKNKADLKRLAKKGAKIAAKTGLQMAGGAALGLTGLAAGASTGDFSKAAQYTGLGALGGAKLGGSLYESMAKSEGIKDLVEETKRGYYGNEEYNRKQSEKMYEEAKKNQDYIAQYKKKMKVDWERAEREMVDMINWHQKNSNVKSFDKMMEIEKATKKMVDELGRDAEEARTRITMAQQLIEETGLTTGTKQKDMIGMFERLQEIHSDINKNVLYNSFFNDSKIFFAANQK